MRWEPGSRPFHVPSNSLRGSNQPGTGGEREKGHRWARLPSRRALGSSAPRRTEGGDSGGTITRGRWRVGGGGRDGGREAGGGAAGGGARTKAAAHTRRRDQVGPHRGGGQTDTPAPPFPGGRGERATWWWSPPPHLAPLHPLRLSDGLFRGGAVIGDRRHTRGWLWPIHWMDSCCTACLKRQAGPVPWRAPRGSRPAVVGGCIQWAGGGMRGGGRITLGAPSAVVRDGALIQLGWGEGCRARYTHIRRREWPLRAPVTGVLWRASEAANAVPYGNVGTLVGVAPRGLVFLSLENSV